MADHLRTRRTADMDVTGTEFVIVDRHAQREQDQIHNTLRLQEATIIQQHTIIQKLEQKVEQMEVKMEQMETKLVRVEQQLFQWVRQKKSK